VSSNTPTFTPTYTATPTASPTYTFTNTYTDTWTCTATPSITQSVTYTNTVSSNTPTLTPTYTNTATQSETWTATQSVTATPTYTNSNTPSNTATQSYTWTATQSATESSTYTQSQTPTATPTQSSSTTQSVTFSATPTYTQTLTYTGTPSRTNTKTVTPTMTETSTYTSTSTNTATVTITLTPMPSPVTLNITLGSAGEAPKVGAIVTYTIHVENDTQETVDNIELWDTLPGAMTYNGSSNTVQPAVDGNYLSWDVTIDPQTGQPFLLGPGKSFNIEFTVVINDVDPSVLPLSNMVGIDYNDPAYTPAIGKHPPIFSTDSFYPIGDPVVYPNPYNVDSVMPLIFDDIVPGSLIQIYTLSGELVAAIQAPTIKTTWNGRNENNRKVSAGIYYFVIHNQASGQVKKGKLFVINGN